MFKIPDTTTYICFVVLALSIFLLYDKTYCVEAGDNIFSELKIEDCPNDGGGAFCITWRRFKGEKGENLYRVYWRNDNNDNILISEFQDTEMLKSGLRIFYGKHRDDINYHGVLIKSLPGVIINKEGTRAKFFIEYLTKSGEVIARSDVYEATTRINWFKTTRMYVLLFIMVFTIIFMFFIVNSKKGKQIFIRKISGLDAIDDAIGRATEMGKPVLYCAGLAPVSGLSTIASLSIFGQIVKKLAQYGTRILVPCYDPIVMSAAQEIAKNSYLQAGRPDLYRERDIYFVTSNQFGYVASVNATMVKEKTATNLFLGSFAAEALLLSETGAANRSVQIAGTDSVAQLPFFVVTCDYTLIGEELYAAAAYISKEPTLLSTLKVQDIFKILVFAVILFESVVNSFHIEILKYIFYVA
ncbi:MAG: DUF6754 domain-containing protein [Planctomycetota bacterium]